MDLAMNADASVNIYFGPDKPIGDKAKNWIPTEPNSALPTAETMTYRRSSSRDVVDISRNLCS